MHSGTKIVHWRGYRIFGDFISPSEILGWNNPDGKEENAMLHNDHNENVEAMSMMHLCEFKEAHTNIFKGSTRAKRGWLH